MKSVQIGRAFLPQWPRTTANLAKLAIIASCATSTVASAQDRQPHERRRAQPGIYQPPTLDAAHQSAPSKSPASPAIVRVAHRTVSVLEQDDQAEPEIQSAPRPRTAPRPAAEMLAVPQGEIVYHDGTYEEAPFGDTYYGGPVGCDDNQCDSFGPSIGCDSPSYLFAGAGCGNDCGGCGSCSPVADCDGWFGSAEYLYWSRRGQDFPNLVLNTTPTTPVSLFGGSQGEDEKSGGRFSIGRWLDRCRSQSIEVRGWGLEEETIDFSVAGTSTTRVARPGFDPLTGLPVSITVIDPAAANGREFLDIGFTSNVYGADVLVHQVMARGLGGRIDFLYGYQFFGLSEDLSISSFAVNTANQLPPLAEITVTDSFEVENEYHAGVFGVATHYDEGCWTFDGMFKLGLGGMTRRTVLSGNTSLFIPPGPASPDGNGALITDLNEGSSSDSTFAVSPEVNIGLGYKLNPCTNVTFGYSYLMVTDALQAWRTVSTTQARRQFSSGDYWVQGIHLGLNFNY